MRSIQITVAFILLAISHFIQAQEHPLNLPFLIQDEQKLKEIKQAYLLRGDSVSTKKVAAVISQANTALKNGPYSVTFHKKILPPSGDKHDYMSQAPYWWPDTTKPGGKPYIRRDGRINPERNLMKDRSQLANLCEDVKNLGLAYYFTGNEKYSSKAAELLQVWFITKDTRMNPNLNYGQGIPGISNGRGIGIIETAMLLTVPDALATMKQSKAMNPGTINGIKGWFSEYLDWLINSEVGKEERAQNNNHGTYYDAQVVDFALFLGKKDLARKFLLEDAIPRIGEQFEEDGAQPHELARTKSLGYASMNLTGWFRLALLAEKAGIDLWNTTAANGTGIKRGLEWFTPYVSKEKNWAFEQIENFGYDRILSLYALAEKKYPNTSYQHIFKLYPDWTERLSNQ
jgi:hypothetical protein